MKPTEQPSVTVKCVICGHKETVPLTAEMPMCGKCFGPVTAEAVSVILPRSTDQVQS